MKTKIKRNYKRIIVYGDFAEYAKLRLALNKQGLTVSEWFRSQTKEYLKKGGNNE